MYFCGRFVLLTVLRWSGQLIHHITYLISYFKLHYINIAVYSIKQCLHGYIYDLLKTTLHGFSYVVRLF
jgi:hypothetical protein